MVRGGKMDFSVTRKAHALSPPFFRFFGYWQILLSPGKEYDRTIVFCCDSNPFCLFPLENNYSFFSNSLYHEIRQVHQSDG